jgi:hypothetical protein
VDFRGVFRLLDDELVLSGGHGNSLALWELDGGHVRRSFALGDAPGHGLAVSADGRVAAIAFADRVELRDLLTDTPLATLSAPPELRHLALAADAGVLLGATPRELWLWRFW